MTTTTDVQAWLEAFAKTIDQEKHTLSDLDTPIGDGDHGNNLARGMTAYREAFTKQPPTTISDTFKLLAMTLVSKVGGASGPLYGTAFLNMAKATKEQATIDGQAAWGDLLAEGLAGIQLRGKANPGDKTMVDVWEPVIAALHANSLDQATITKAKEATAALVAKKGRASYLGERSVGHVDPGAASSSFLFIDLLPYL